MKRVLMLKFLLFMYVQTEAPKLFAVIKDQGHQDGIILIGVKKNDSNHFRSTCSELGPVLRALLAVMHMIFTIALLVGLIVYLLVYQCRN